ncbi:MAG TPA: hypothetical protein DDW52_09130, partial [Planctomycetaceae bacterium]|nr:hypothetical protein [Planctomycetaceae bacterium]
MYSASRSDVRTLFISDVHLGSKYCNPKPLIELLLNVCPEHVYLVGDICDGWILRRNWLWNRDSESFVETLGKLERKGSRITYLLGNHDRCLQRWVSEWGNFWVGEKCIHTLTDGRKLLLIHGDQFDRTQIKFSSAAAFTARIHE